MTTTQKATHILTNSKRDQWSGSLSPIEDDRKLKINLGQQLIHQGWILKNFGKKINMKGKKYARFDFFDIHSEKIKKTNSWDSMFKIINKTSKEVTTTLFRIRILYSLEGNICYWIGNMGQCGDMGALGVLGIIYFDWSNVTQVIDETSCLCCMTFMCVLKSFSKIKKTEYIEGRR